MTKLLSPVLAEIEPSHVGFGCPGCRDTHVIPVSDAHTPGRSWGFNGVVERPTFTPSIKVTGVQTVQNADWEWAGGWVRGPDGNALPTVCHCFVTDGQIQFLGDCTHALAGQTVDLPPYPVRQGGRAVADSDGNNGA